MSHRIEISKNNRAGCTDGVCKANGVKIKKEELRFGSWVEIPQVGHGSWKWKHWGCVSGAQIQNVRDKIGMGDGEYRWDAIDGYDELGDHPEIQAKIRRVIEQGHIDPEEFNGDPEYNVLGQRAIRGRAKKPKPEDDEDEDGDVKSSPAKATPAKKRGRKKAAADDDEEEEDEPPKKKAKAAKKATPKKEKHVKEEEEDWDEPPVNVKITAKTKKATATKIKPGPIKGEEDEEDEAPEPPAKKGKAAAVAKRAPRAAAQKSQRKKAPTPEPRNRDDTFYRISEPEDDVNDDDDEDFASESAEDDEDEDDNDDDDGDHQESESGSDAGYKPGKRSGKGKGKGKAAPPPKKATARTGPRKSYR